MATVLNLRAKLLKVQTCLDAINKTFLEPCTNKIENVQDFLLKMYAIYEHKYEKTTHTLEWEVSLGGLGSQKLRIWSILHKDKQYVSQSLNYSEFYNYINIYCYLEIMK